ncbi:MAG: hypothetical protein WBA38_11750 [Gordonia sp. (in: high G+C Gram-positive bacteria)]|uniref:hypothetical protein n=1 Tax=Gordonia sp. (in: high G+C Gram-positive bacteria) TaxID=84139 RepID=UPI003C710837
MTEESTRLRHARERYDDAFFAEKRAREAAEPIREQRARRAGLLTRLTAFAGALAAIGLVAAGWWAHSDANDSAAVTADAIAARAAAEQAIVTMLTADPSHANSYIDGVLAVSTGDQSIRLKGAREELTALVRGLAGPTTGQIVSSGVTGIEANRAGNDKTEILLVAQTTTPELVGGTGNDNRVGLTVTMVRDGDQWKVQQTRTVT